MISLILTTHGHAKDAQVVVNEMIKATKTIDEPSEVIVVTHNFSSENVPQGGNFIHEINPRLGCASSVHYGAFHCKGDWDVYLCDDHKFPDPLWLKKAIYVKNSNPNVKLIGFNDHRMRHICPAIGMFNVAWYREKYNPESEEFKEQFPDGYYEHYGWEDDNKLTASLEIGYNSNIVGNKCGGWLYSEEVVIIHDWVDRVNKITRKRDYDLRWNKRKPFLIQQLSKKRIRVEYL